MPRKPKKRASGEGTIYYDPKRKRWIVQLAPDPLTGKRAQGSAATEREALALKKQMEAERTSGKDLTAKQPTLADFLTTWLEQVIQPTLKPSTHGSYQQVVDAYVVPTLGRHRLEALTPPLLQRWVNQLAKDYAPATVRNAYLRLRAALDVAVDWRYLSSNPAARLRLAALPPSSAQTYTVNELRYLLAAARGWRLEGLLWALALLGLRRGEGLGLAWRDLDWDAGTIRITQQVQLINGKTVISPSPKTPTSRRVLPLASGLLRRWREHWNEQQEEQAHLGIDWHEHGLIFPSENGTPLTPSNFHRSIKLLMQRADKQATAAAQRAEEPVVRTLRIHDLRHTTATLLGEQGEREEVIAVLLGHAPATITRQYTHVQLETIRVALERLEQMLMGEQHDAHEADR